MPAISFKLRAFLSVVMTIAMFAVPASAYIGPGASIGAIGTFFAVIGAVVLLIVGFLWYPIKRMIKGSKKQDAPIEQSETSTEKQ